MRMRGGEEAEGAGAAAMKALSWEVWGLAHWRVLCRAGLL